MGDLIIGNTADTDEIVRNFFRDTRDNVEEEIKRKIENERIYDALKGGKRLRSILSMLIFQICKNKKPNNGSYKRALEGTVSIELAHAASLVHDDIIDKDAERRGEPAMHIKNGIGSALLTGHKMIAIGFDIALSHGNKMGKLYVETWNTALSGELLEINSNGKNSKKKKSMSSRSLFNRYKEIIDLKTASLFASACKFGALETNASKELIEVFGEYGREIGLAYQLADDLVDLTQGERIDSVITSLIEALKIKYREEEKLYELLSKGNLLENAPKIKNLYVKEIRKHLKRAEKLASSKEIPDNEYTPYLKAAPRFIINQMLKDINMVI